MDAVRRLLDQDCEIDDLYVALSCKPPRSNPAVATRLTGSTL